MTIGFLPPQPGGTPSWRRGAGGFNAYSAWSLLIHCSFGLFAGYSVYPLLVRCLFADYLVTYCPSTAYSLLIRCLFEYLSPQKGFFNRVHNGVTPLHDGTGGVLVKPKKFEDQELGTYIRKWEVDHNRNLGEIFGSLITTTSVSYTHLTLPTKLEV